MEPKVVKLMALFGYNILHSVLDVASDMVLFFDYLLGGEYIKEYVLLNDTTAMEDQTNRILGNITIRSCTIMNRTCSEEGVII